MKLAAIDNNLLSIPEFLSGGGEMGQLIRDFDWASTSLGPTHKWPQSLRTCVRDYAYIAPADMDWLGRNS